MADIRDSMQQGVVAKYIEWLSQATTKRSTMVLGTGVGKSKIVIDIIKALKLPKVMIIVNSTELKDNSWEVEFTKFGMGDYYRKNVLMQTYQTVHKWENKNLEHFFVFADEVDYGADVPEYSKFFYNFPDLPVLGVTGFVTKKKREWFAGHLPIIYEYTTLDAQRDGLLNKLHFKFVKYELSKAKDYKVEFKKAGVTQSFYSSEAEAYRFADKKFRTLLGDQTTLRNGRADMAEDDYRIASEKLQKKIDWAINSRNKILLNSNTTANMAARILETVTENHKNKIVTFSVYTKQAQKVTPFTFNGANKAAKNKKNFDDFNQGKLQVLGVCGKIDRGTNVDGLNVLIFETFYGSDTTMNQRLGRGCRLPVDQTGTVYVLLPYFRRKALDGTFTLAETQQVTWARNALSPGVVTKENSEIIDLTLDAKHDG